MLMQSHSQEISLLPALPEQWPKGGIQGLRARGGFTVNIFWDKGQLKSALIYSEFRNTCKIRTRLPVVVLYDNKEVECKRMEDNVVQFSTEAGKSYKIVNH